MPPDNDTLKQVFRDKNYLFTAHASQRGVQRGINSTDIEEAVIAGEVIEDYPDDKYGPSCLILGTTISGKVLHIQVSYPPNVKLITLYEPSSDEWENDWKTRKLHE